MRVMNATGWEDLHTALYTGLRWTEVAEGRLLGAILSTGASRCGVRGR